MRKTGIYAKCETCGKPIYIPFWQRNLNKKYCSIACRWEIEKRFWGNIEKTDYCWNWTGKTSRGYGQLGYKYKVIYAHRMSWFLAYGKFPEKFVLHHCDNPLCVRPDHLFEGTQLDNMHDAIKKKRFKYLQVA